MSTPAPLARRLRPFARLLNWALPLAPPLMQWLLLAWLFPLILMGLCIPLENTEVHGNIGLLLLAFQLVFLFPVLVLNGLGRSLKFTREFSRGYGRFLASVPYNGSSPPPFAAPYRHIGDVLFLACILFTTLWHTPQHALVFARFPPLWQAAAGLWLVTEVFATLHLNNKLGKRFPMLVLAWNIPLLRLVWGNPGPFLGLLLAQVLVGQVFLRRGMRHHFAQAGEPVPREVLRGGHWKPLAPRPPHPPYNPLQGTFPTLLIGWWFYAFVPNLSLSTFPIFGLFAVGLVCLGWFCDIISKYPPPLNPRAMLAFGWGYAARYFRLFLGPVLLAVLVWLLCGSVEAFAGFERPGPLFAAVTMMLITKFICDWSWVLRHWEASGVQPLRLTEFSIVYTDAVGDVAKPFRAELGDRGKPKGPAQPRRPQPVIQIQRNLLGLRAAYQQRKWIDSLLVTLSYVPLACLAALSGEHLRIGLLIFGIVTFVAAVIVSVLSRLRTLHPLYNVGYREFLKATPWRPGCPLPLGTPLLTWRDPLSILWHALVGAFAFTLAVGDLRAMHLKSFAELYIYAVCILAGLSLLLRWGTCLLLYFRTGMLKSFLAMLWLAPCLPLLGVSPWFALGLVPLLVLNEVCLAASLRGFPWAELPIDRFFRLLNEGKRNRSYKDYVEGELLSRAGGFWLLADFIPTPIFTRKWGTGLLLTFVWWLCIMIAVAAPEPIIGFFVLIGGIFMCIGALGSRLNWLPVMAFPSLGERVARRKLILWHADKFWCAPLCLLLLELFGVIMILGHDLAQADKRGGEIDFSHPWILPVLLLAAPLLLNLIPPRARKFWLTGGHRVRTEPRRR